MKIVWIFAPVLWQFTGNGISKEEWLPDKLIHPKMIAMKAELT